MSDLISRKAIMNYLREQQVNVIVERNKNSCIPYEATEGMLSSVDAFMNFIVQLPAAYDVEKVVEQLETKVFTADLYDFGWNGETVDNLLCLGDVYEIVKGAVKE